MLTCDAGHPSMQLFILLKTKLNGKNVFRFIFFVRLNSDILNINEQGFNLVIAAVHD